MGGGSGPIRSEGADSWRTAEVCESVSGVRPVRVVWCGDATGPLSQLIVRWLTRGPELLSLSQEKCNFGYVSRIFV